MISMTSQYALRAMTYLAALPKGVSALGRELAHSCSVPPHYLTSIFVVLRNAGLIAAARGRHGGYRLSKSPGSIRLVDIIELFDGPQETPVCLLYGGKPCERGARQCAAHAAWEDVQKIYTRFLEKTTLAHIAAKGRGHGTKAVPA